MMHSSTTHSTEVRHTLRWSQRLVLILSGVLCALSFESFDIVSASIFRVLPFISLPILLWHLYHAASRRIAMGSIFYFALGMFATGVHWVYISLYYYGEASFAIAVAANVLLILYLSAIMSLAGLLIYAIRQCRGWAWLLYVASAWMLAEWLRATLLGGFPWLQLGVSQTSGLLAGYLPLIGANATTFVIWLAAGGLMFGLFERRRIWLLVPIILIGIGLVLRPIEWTTTKAQSLRVALIQGNVDQNLHWSYDLFYDTWERYMSRSADSLTENPDFILWPETVVSNYYNGASPSQQSIRDTQIELAKSFDTDLIFGTIWKAENKSPGNALVHISPDDGAEQVYLKNYLLPFGEKIPFQSLLAPIYKQITGFDIMPMATRGNNQPLFTIDGIMIAPFICFESVFGHELLRRTSQSNLLVNVSNDGWFRGSIAFNQHLQINKARAMENQRWLARANNTGISAIIDHQGRIQDHIPAPENISSQPPAQMLIGDVQIRQGQTPYQMLGDWPFRILWIMIILIGLIYRYSHSRRSVQS